MACDNFMWFPESASGNIVASGKTAKPEGETTDKWFGADKYKATELLSLQFGVAQAETTGSGSTGAGAGKAKFEEFQVEKFVDKMSVPLYIACCAGAHYPTVMLAVRKVGGGHLVYLQYIFRQVFVTNITWNGGGGEEAPKETIKFKFGAMAIQYIRQKSDGTAGNKIDGRWSVITNKNTWDVPGLKGSPEWLPQDMTVQS